MTQLWEKLEHSGRLQLYTLCGLRPQGIVTRVEPLALRAIEDHEREVQSREGHVISSNLTKNITLDCIT